MESATLVDIQSRRKLRKTNTEREQCIQEVKDAGLLLRFGIRTSFLAVFGCLFLVSLGKNAEGSYIHYRASSLQQVFLFPVSLDFRRGAAADFMTHSVDNSEPSEKIPTRNNLSKSHHEKTYVRWNDSSQIPINSHGMSFRRWWGDLRYEQERRIIVASIVILFFTLIFVAFLAYSKIESMRKEDELEMSDGSVEALAAEQAKPLPLNGVLEQAAKCVSDARFEDAAPLLQSVELELVRLQGTVAFKTGDLPKAETLFERALVIDPASIPDLINLADLRLRTGKAALAVALFNRAQATSPDNIYVANRYLLARIEAGDVAGVRSEIQTALKLSPKNCLPRVAVSAAALELSIGQYVNAANFLYAAQSKLPAQTFKSLLNETPISSYAARSELRPFFAPPGVMGPAPVEKKSER